MAFQAQQPGRIWKHGSGIRRGEALTAHIDGAGSPLRIGVMRASNRHVERVFHEF
jgi:hypothetical protein